MKKFQLTAILLMSLTSVIAMQFDTDPVNDSVVLAQIIYIEETEEIDLGFDTQKYLPRGFNPYEKFFDIHSIEYIESEPEISFSFNINDYLPADFKAGVPYFNFLSIPFIEEFNEEEFYNELKAFIKTNSLKQSK